MGERIKVVLACEKCGRRNFETTRSSGITGKTLTLKKHCPGCNAHTVHHETK